MDLQMVDSNLFILDYEVGVFQLKLVGLGFQIERAYEFTHYSKMTANLNSLVVSKQGSVTEFRGRNTFKYETVGTEIVKELIIS
jgi:hypothetical protein